MDEVSAKDSDSKIVELFTSSKGFAHNHRKSRGFSIIDKTWLCRSLLPQSIVVRAASNINTSTRRIDNVHFHFCHNSIFRAGIADGWEFEIRPQEPLLGFLIKINNKN